MIRFDAKGVYFGTPFFYCKKNFIRKALILLGLFNITKKKIKKSSKKLFTFKKVVYICKVNKAQNNKNKNYENNVNRRFKNKKRSIRIYK